MPMRSPHLAYGVCLCFGLFCPGAYPSDAEPAKKAEPERADYDRLGEIFSPPGTPSIKGKRWAAVETGPTNWSTEQFGWIVEETPAGITLVDLYGETSRLRKPTADEKRPKLKEEKDGELSRKTIHEADYSVAWKIRPEDFTAKLKKFLADGLPGEKQDKQDIYASFNQRFNLKDHVTESARLAYFAHRAGLEQQATDLFAHALKARRTYQDQYREGEDLKELHLFVAEAIAKGQRNSAIYVGHLQTPRKELKKSWEKLAAIPYHSYREEAKTMARHYQELIDEDKRWVEPDTAALAKMTDEHKVSYWIYHLRDLDVGQSSDPGSCRVLGEWGFDFLARDEKKRNAAVELKKLGLAAVPQLIAHLDDARPTRCKAHWRRYWPDGHYLLCYGDCCQQIFESITRRTISTETYPIQAGKGKECKAKAEQWWQEFMKDQKQTLIKGTAAGDRDSPNQGEWLLERYPEAALKPIVQGAKASKNAWVRAAMVQIAARVKDEKVADFLREELEGPFLDSRIKAARALTARGDPSGVKALMHEWKQLRVKKVNRWDNSWAIDDLVDSLLYCGDPLAIRLVMEELPDHDVNTRSRVINRLTDVQRDLRDRPLSREYEDAVEELLVKLMSDLEVESSLSSRGDKVVRDPMIADLAAEALAQRWQQPKLFEITAPLQTRERQRLELQNRWLKKHGKPLLVVPATRRIKPVPDDRIQALVKTVVDSKSAADRKQTLKPIEELGLPALSGVRKCLKDVEPKHPAHSDIQALAARLALIVREVRFGADSVKPTDSFRRNLESLQGSPITETAFMDLLTGTARALPEGVRGVRITLERIPDDTGVYLAVTLVADCPPRKGLAPQLTYGSRLVIGGEHHGGGIGLMAGVGREVGLAEIDWSDFTKKLRKGLQSQADDYLLVIAHCAEKR
jgi:hypothetical protein